MRTTPAPNTLQAKIQGPDGELIATQPGEVELNNGSASGMTDTAAVASVNTGKVTPADMRSTPAPNTLKAKIQGPDGELLATQPGEVQLNESRRLVVR
jgi:propanediol dehydratase small subunit